jgi:hypothetical protein
MKFLVYGKRDCVVCEKAEAILARLGVPFAFASIAPEDYAQHADPALLTALSDFYWCSGNPDSLPLVVAVDDSLAALHSWIGLDVANAKSSWLAEVRWWLAAAQPLAARREPVGVMVVESEEPELPVGVA